MSNYKIQGEILFAGLCVVRIIAQIKLRTETHKLMVQ